MEVALVTHQLWPCGSITCFGGEHLFYSTKLHLCKYISSIPFQIHKMERQTKGKPPEDLWRLDQVFCQLLCFLELTYLNVSNSRSSSNLEYTLSCPEILLPVTGHPTTVRSVSPFTWRWQHEHRSLSGEDALGAVESMREKIGNRRWEPG